MSLVQQRDQTIALAAICQTAVMVCDASRGKALDQDALTQLLNAIMHTSPKSVYDVYQTGQKFRGGCNTMLTQISGNTDHKDMELTRYISGMMALSKKLMQSNAAQILLADSIEQMTHRLAHFDITSHAAMSHFAEAYSEIVSPLGKKIQVMGNANVLIQGVNQSKIRALLLAGVRAGVLWRQMGGRRRQLIFNRKQILQDAVLFQKEITSY